MGTGSFKLTRPALPVHVLIVNRSWWKEDARLFFETGLDTSIMHTHKHTHTHTHTHIVVVLTYLFFLPFLPFFAPPSLYISLNNATCIDNRVT